MSSIRVFIVDDSAVSRLALRKALEGDPLLAIVGEAKSGREALERIPVVRPNVVLMDIVMPDIDGLAATAELMRSNPLPILIISGQVEGDARLTFDALRAGALEVIGKPSAAELASEDHVRRLQRRVRLLSEIPVVRRHSRVGRVALRSTTTRPTQGSVSLVCLGMSTGGPPALLQILSALPSSPAWPVFVVQHMTPGFIGGMVSWLKNQSRQNVVLASDGIHPEPGTIYVADDDHHLILEDGCIRMSMIDAPSQPGHRPSVDALFSSVAGEQNVREAIAVLLTGMGKDGAAGLGKIRRAGGWTVAQDEASSVVYGMPKAAADEEAACEVLSLNDIKIALAALA